MSTLELEQRITSLDAEVAQLKEGLEHTRMVARIRRGIDQANRGEVVPAREALEALRQKYNIPLP